MRPAWLLLLSAFCFGLYPLTATADMRSFLDAVAQVETGGSANPALARGDSGRSLGPYQISWKYWKDSGVGGSYRWVTNKAYAEQVMLAYWRKHCPQALARRDYRTLARIHNGGPDGTREPKTSAYWQRVRQAMR
ncbi:MAG TPA: hypothetical protein PKY77_15665 [Phycisphaerae bacterium]|nr:hypothetical protein [Phycisphaerae bacterium]HRY66869.1 hypothetical protein [Phycisphaerae bacterium]HSA26927.1 hypothetical protein [Phycisphaerae bacterium]